MFNISDFRFSIMILLAVIGAVLAVLVFLAFADLDPEDEMVEIVIPSSQLPQ